MDYEKKYKEALENARQEYNTTENVERKQWLEELFPELKESEGEVVEKIRKELLSYLGNRQIKTLVESNAVEIWRTWIEKQDKKEYVLKSSKNEDVIRFMQKIEKLAKSYDIDLPHRGYDIYAFAKDILAWLERQNQVKETAISQHENKTCKENDDSLTCKDKNILKAIIYTVKNSGYNYCIGVSNDEMVTWLEKRKDYVSSQMVADAYLRGCNDTEKKWLEKQGQAFPILSNSSKTGKNETKWTEEDSLMIDSIIDTIKWLKGKGAADMKIEWLESLKQRMEQ